MCISIDESTYETGETEQAPLETRRSSFASIARAVRRARGGEYVAQARIASEGGREEGSEVGLSSSQDLNE